ncbi:MAG: hypothetical protein WC655_15420 [Candidatus Hydrogenedentales bacterium]
MMKKVLTRTGIAFTLFVLGLAVAMAGCATKGSGGSSVKHVHGPDGKYHQNIVVK